jgi:hypothetical protein
VNHASHSISVVFTVQSFFLLCTLTCQIITKKDIAQHTSFFIPERQAVSFLSQPRGSSVAPLQQHRAGRGPWRTGTAWVRTEEACASNAKRRGEWQCRMKATARGN